MDNTDRSFLEEKQEVRKVKDQDDDESRRTWHLVTKYLKNGDVDQATKYKNLVEERERAFRRMREEKNITIKPKHFVEMDGKLAEKIGNKNSKVITLYKSIYESRTPYQKGEKDVFESLEEFSKF